MANVKDLSPGFTEMATSLGGKLEWTTLDQYRYINRFQLNSAGITIVAEPNRTQKGAIVGVLLRALLSKPPSNILVKLRRETAIDRLGKKLRINREFQFGDDAFDGQVYIESDAPYRVLKELLDDAPIRGTVAFITSGIADSIELGIAPLNFQNAKLNPVELANIHRSITLSISKKHFKNRDGILASVAALAQLAREFESVIGKGKAVPNAEALPSQTPKTLFAFGSMVLVWIIAIATTSYFAMPPTIGWHAYGLGCIVGGLLWLVVNPVFIALFRGRSTSFRIVITLMIFSFGFFPMCGNFAERINAAYDHGSPVKLATTGRVQHPQSTKSSPFPKVVIPETGDEIDVRYAPGIVLSDNPTPVCVVIRPGALGSPWVERVDAIAACWVPLNVQRITPIQTASD